MDLRLTIAQTNPALGDFHKNLDDHLRQIRAATAEGASAEPVVEEIQTRDIVAVENADGIELLATRDILSVDLSPEDAALLE